jgi:hypothetical protein
VGRAHPDAVGQGRPSGWVARRSKRGSEPSWIQARVSRA